MFKALYKYATNLILAIKNIFLNIYFKFRSNTTKTRARAAQKRPETQIVPYSSNVLSFSNSKQTTDRTANNQRLFAMAINKLKQTPNNQDLLRTLKQEYALSSNFKIMTIATIHETGDRAQDFIKNNENKLILAGLNLLEDENFLNEGSYTGLFNKINLKYFKTSNSDVLDSEKRLDYLAAIICISWALSAINKKRGYDVIRGSCTITNNDSIYKFFLEYVKLVTNSNTPGYLLNSSSFAYARNPKRKLSSHYPNDSDQYGIDIRFEAAEESFGILPHGHKHILFGLIKSTPIINSTFFKFEPHGMGTFHDWLQHGIDFANAGTVSGVTYREKDVPSEFKKAYTMFCNRISEATDAKLVKEMWQHINKITTSYSKEEEDYLEWHIVKNNDIIPEAEAAKKEFQIIASRHNMDINNLHHRCGNEVLMEFPNNNTIINAAIDYESKVNNLQPVTLSVRV